MLLPELLVVTVLVSTSPALPDSTPLLSLETNQSTNQEPSLRPALPQTTPARSASSNFVGNTTKKEPAIEDYKGLIYTQKLKKPRRKIYHYKMIDGSVTQRTQKVKGVPDLTPFDEAHPRIARFRDWLNVISGGGQAALTGYAAKELF